MNDDDIEAFFTSIEFDLNFCVDANSESISVGTRIEGVSKLSVELCYLSTIDMRAFCAGHKSETKTTISNSMYCVNLKYHTARKKRNLMYWISSEAQKAIHPTSKNQNDSESSLIKNNGRKNIYYLCYF